MNMKSIFYELPYWEHINISHLLDPMHIFKNVSSSLWSHISLKQSEALTIMDSHIISSNTKKKDWPRQVNRGEVSPSWSFKEGHVPWILMKDELSFIKELILGVKVPSLYGSTL